MKKTKVFLILAGIIAASLSSCSNAIQDEKVSNDSNYAAVRAAEKTSDEDGASVAIPLEWTTYVSTSNHMYVTESMIGQEIKVTAPLSVSGDYFSMTENPSSRSRVTIGLDVEDEELKQELRKLKGEKITVVGILTEVYSPWSKRMKALRIEENGEIEDPFHIHIKDPIIHGYTWDISDLLRKINLSEKSEE